MFLHYLMKSTLKNMIRVFLICLVIGIILQSDGVEGRKRNNKSRHRRTFSSGTHDTSQRRHRGHAHKKISQRKSSSPTTLYSLGKEYATQANYPFQIPSRRHHRQGSARTEVIEDAILTLPGLSQLLEPMKHHHGNLKPLIKESHDNYLQGTVRQKRLYCRVGIGFHLEIKANGKVTANHGVSSDGVMEIFSVNRSVVGIRSSQWRRYLCMDKAGRVFTRKTFRPDCAFREKLERNNFNSYASEKYSDHKTRTGYFLAITRKGRIPKRMKKASWKQKRAHWLPRSV